MDSLSIMAPASPGGGWDGTARAMQQALQKENIVKNVEVTNVPGAGGTIGLAQFAGSSGQGDELMVSGLVMLGAILTNKRSEEHTSELQSLMRISYAVFCLKKKNS